MMKTPPAVARTQKHHLFLFALFCLLASTVSFAQVTGVYFNAPYDNYGFDSINRGNLNVHFSVPVFSKPGRGGTNFIYNLNYDGLVYTPSSVSGSSAWLPVENWGWTDSTNAFFGYITYNGTMESCTYSSPTPPHLQLRGFLFSRYGYVYHDNKGVAHPFPYSWATTECNISLTSQPTGTSTYTLTDNSGLSIYQNGTIFTVFTPGGAQSVVPTVASFNGAEPSTSTGTTATFTDNNGNQIIASSSGAFVDTMGKTALSVTGAGSAPTPEVFTYTDSNGKSQTVTINYSTFNVLTAFGVSSISEYSSSNVPLVTSIVYSADNSSYSFTYEPTPGNSSTVTGRLASVTLRTGGTIHYSYTGGSNGIESDGTYSGLTRTTTDGPYTYTRSSITSTASSTQRTDALNNVDTSTYLINAGYFFESDHATYQGAATGTPLTETETCYNTSNAAPCPTSSVSSGISSIHYSFYNNGAQYDYLTQTYGAGQLITDTSSQFGSTLYTYTAVAGIGNLAFLELTGVSATHGPYGSSSQYTYGYDETAPTPTSGLPNHVAVTTARGNRTSVHAWYNSSKHVDQTSTYDDAGQVLTQTDFNGNPTGYTYDTATDTLLTKTNYPASLSSTSTYDPNTGLLTGTSDVNGNSTSYIYDGLERPTSATAPYMGSTASTTYTYPNAETTVQTVAQHGSSVNTVTYVTDGYGRQSTVTQADTNGNEVTAYGYDADGRLYSVTNPHRSTSSSTDGTTYYNYDGASRLSQLTEPDASKQSYTYNGPDITVMDEQGKQRQFVVNHANQILQVNEPDASGNFTLATVYSYDSAGHVVTVQQQGGGTSSQYRTRTFAYDFAGRITSETTPEQGTTTYSYLNLSRVPCSGSPSLPCQRTDARGTSTYYAYDALNRLTGKTYSDTTAPVAIVYDQSSANGLAIANGKGNRTSMSDASGTSAWSYDPMGRVVADKRTLGSQTKTALWSYNLDGTTSSFTDYAGNTVNYGYDSMSNLTSVTDATTGVAYLGGGLYAPPGTLASATLGNGVSLLNQYNPKMQPTALTASLNGTQIFGLILGYGNAGYNNGTIASIVNFSNSARSASYSYDQLNRLTSAQAGSLWGYSYGYDNWGNLTSMTPASGVSNGETALSTTATVSNQLPVNQYDADGRVTTDNIGNNYTYDAEGRILTVSGYTYTYDGDGNRVAKVSGGSGRLYWPDLNGNTANETNLTGGATVRNVTVNGTQIARQDASGNWWYFLHDQLGTPKMVLNASGTVASDTDYYPFGGTAYSFGSTSNLYGFTGYETDSESSSNYAVFRNQSPSTGRFLRPDPYDGSYDITNPQSFNRYSYVLNNPIKLLDPLGLDSSSCTESIVYDSDGNVISDTTNCNVVADDPGDIDLGENDYYGGLVEGEAPNNFNCHDLAAGKTPSGSASSWWSGYVNASSMLDNWLAGTGPTSTTFGPGSPESQQMMGAYGLAGNVGAFLNGGPSSGFQNFGLRGLVASGLNPTAQFVGSYGWSMSLSGGNLNITLTNATTMYSAFYHAPGLNPNPPTRFDSVFNPGRHPMGRVNQTFQIQVPCS